MLLHQPWELLEQALGVDPLALLQVLVEGVQTQGEVVQGLGELTLLKIVVK